MNVTVLRDALTEDRAVLHLNGRLDATSAPEFKRVAKQTIGEGRPNLIAELSDVSFVDSSGLAGLVSAHKATREAGGSLKLVGLRGHARKILELTMLDRVFDIQPDLDAAKASYGEG